MGHSFNYLEANVISSNSLNKLGIESAAMALGRILQANNLGRALKIRVYPIILRIVILYAKLEQTNGPNVWELESPCLIIECGGYEDIVADARVSEGMDDNRPAQRVLRA